MLTSNNPMTRDRALRVVRAGPSFRGKQGHFYAPALSSASVGTKAIHMQMLTIPPGEVGRAHKHEGHETAIYILSGESGVWFGENLEHHETARAGEFVYIPASVPHRPYNLSETLDCVAIIARTDPNEQESVVLLPALEGKTPALLGPSEAEDHRAPPRGDTIVSVAHQDTLRGCPGAPLVASVQASRHTKIRT